MKNCGMSEYLGGVNRKGWELGIKVREISDRDGEFDTRSSLRATTVSYLNKRCFSGCNVPKTCQSKNVS